MYVSQRLQLHVNIGSFVRYPIVFLEHVRQHVRLMLPRGQFASLRKLALYNHMT